MGSYIETYGDIIEYTRNNTFDVITHGCNCQSKMGAGLAVSMKKEFGCDRFPMEQQKASALKLGNIDYETRHYQDNKWVKYPDENGFWIQHSVVVINSYTQEYYGRGNQLDYEALTLCMRKINSVFKGCHIGLPQIGAGLAGGDWSIIKNIIKKELKDCDVTVVIYT